MRRVRSARRGSKALRAIVLVFGGLILADIAAVEGTTIITFSNGGYHRWVVGEGSSPIALSHRGDKGFSSAHHKNISNGDLLESWCYSKIMGTSLDSKPDGWSKEEISDAPGTLGAFMCLGGPMLLRVKNANRKKLEQVNRKKDS